MRSRRRTWLYIALLILFTGVLIWSAIHPKDRSIWFYEAGPAVLGVALLGILYKRFPLTPISYVFIFIGGLITLTGGHYTYQGVPWFDQFSDRNHFDRLGHAVQGIVSAALLREIFIRRHVVKKAFLTTSVIGLCLAFSGGYEILEFLSGTIRKEEALEEFLGYQGDTWDTQWDMICALAGSILFLLFFHKTQDKQIQQIEKQKL
ncbi:DUF2238 domain-containing protein [Salinithrix halophila]|uniref:DUF2238 domain-containing protein n=1 Tax=Salinithrix halophila TaxID=1485204 RepID=A0ABV8JC18_9BACL